jgi:hypothetical protein
MNQYLVEGQNCTGLYVFSDTRVLVTYEGVPVFIDKVANSWELSGRPAEPGNEMNVFEHFQRLTREGTTEEYKP